MTLNTTNRTPIKVLDKYLPTAERFTYLGSVVTKGGIASDDIKNRIAKARNTFILLNNIWKSSQFSQGTKLKLYQSCVLSTLLYGSECWRMTEGDLEKLSFFHTKCLRRIAYISGPKQKATKTC